MDRMSSIDQLVEASIYVDDLEKAIVFYRDVLCLESIGIEPGRHAFFKVGQGVLLIFVPAATQRGGDAPPHGAIGPGHVALGIPAGTIPEWRARLETVGVVIEKQTDWPKGSTSIYFRDPAGNSVELITPGLWGLPSGY
jgi:catechol 2,3-dioxygenase-like lactoylglutathione lyase family enzyme